MDDKELQEFWEWCGLTFKDEVGYHGWYKGVGAVGLEWVAGKLDIDLNNLFKYAVPKLLPKYAPIEMVAYPSDLYGYHFSVMKKYSADHKDPALALYQAIQKARKVNNG